MRLSSLASSSSGAAASLALVSLLVTQTNDVHGFALSSSSLSRHLPQSHCSSLALQATASLSPKYVRWQQTPEGWAMQTAVTTFERSWNEHGDASSKNRLELHAQLHFGDHAYFDHYNSATFNDGRTVLYELLLDEGLLSTTPSTNQRVVTSPLSASPSDQQTAQQYGWTCQVDTIRYHDKADHWIHADLTRQEFLELAQQQSLSSSTPLWQVAQNTQSPFVVPPAAAEAATALLVGPPILVVAPQQQRRRLFSNLFLPGDTLAQTLRALLWFTVPSPELSILLLDWSSLFVKANGVGLSPMTMPLLQAVLTAQFQAARRLVFGQVILTGGQDDTKDVLIQPRNQKALQVLQQQLVAGRNNTLALLYGCRHCAALHHALVHEHDYRAVHTEWRTAWTVTSPSSSSPENAPTVLWGLAVLLPVYFAIGGLDWMATLGDLTAEGRGLTSLALYLARHLLLYVGLSKVLLDWDTDKGVSASQ